MYQCLTCNHQVSEEDSEVVPATKNPVRRRHKTWEGCQAAMSQPTAAAKVLSPRGRTTKPHPTLGQMDKQADHGHWR
jgi:hypothetical protein